MGSYPAKTQDWESIQEGVERQEHFDFLKRIGCEMAQGYLFARPMELWESRSSTRAKGLKWNQFSYNDV